jgi:hypothetical protein
MRQAHTLGLVAALVFLPSVALAAEPGVAATPEAFGVLAVENPPGPGAELVDLTKSLRGAVAEKAPGVVSTEDLRLRMSAQAGTSSLSELDRAYAGAVAASQSGDYEGASRTLRAVVEDLETMTESGEGFALWSRAMLRLARSEGSLGRKGEAKETLERLVRADPTVAADPELYPPSFAKQLDEIRAAIRAAPRQKLTVTAGGRVATVFIEGRSAGAAPVTVVLPRGRYRITGQMGQVQVSAGKIDVGAEDQTVALDFTVAEMLRPAGGPGLAVPAAQRAKSVVAAAGMLRLTRLLTASVDLDGDVRYLVGSLYDVRKGALQREARLRLNGWAAPAGGLSALSGFLVAGQPSNLVLVNSLPAAGSPSPASTSSSKPGSPSRTKGWIAVGGTALAVGLGVASAVEGSLSGVYYNNARVMLDKTGKLLPSHTQAEYDQMRSQGATASTLAWVTGGAAVGVAAVSGVMAYLSYKQTGEIGPFRF